MVTKKQVDYDAYISSLQQEIELRKDYLHEPVRTIYFGGGTPSLLGIKDLEHILTCLHKSFDLSLVEEITLEGNPEQLSLEYCQQLHQIGFNRISIGVQSFFPHVLKFMGRRHSGMEATNAVNNAKAAGFDNISIDLIYGVSQRNDFEWCKDVETAFSSPITHLSCYALTSEENSILYKQIQNARQMPIDDEQAARNYKALLELLPKYGFEQYEVSNFAKPGFESKHNSSYWNHTPYLGLGPSAHSFDGQYRHWNHSDLKKYCSTVKRLKPYGGREKLTKKDLFNETVLLGLRTRNGLDLSSMEEKYGKKKVAVLMDYFHDKVRPEYYEEKESRLRLTETGLWFADGIAGDAFLI